jgi:hypothetical protein
MKRRSKAPRSEEKPLAAAEGDDAILHWAGRAHPNDARQLAQHMPAPCGASPLSLAPSLVASSSPMRYESLKSAVGAYGSDFES